MKNEVSQSQMKIWVKSEFERAKRDFNLTQAQVADALDVSQPTVHALIYGKRKIQIDELPILESLFMSDVGSYWERRETTRGTMSLLADGLTSALMPKGVPLVSWVSAGAMVKDEHFQEDFEDYPLAYAPDLDPNGDWIALRVDGRSMDKISPHDSIIFVNRKETSLVPNACYVILDSNGDASYKRFSPPNKFEPVSTKPQDYETITFEPGGEPFIIGRVRKTVLSM